jgi:hypothetical protein
LTIKENGDWENVFVGVGVGQDGTVPLATGTRLAMQRPRPKG